MSKTVAKAKPGWLSGIPIEIEDGWLKDSPEGEPYCWKLFKDGKTGIVHVLKYHGGGHIYNHTLCKLSYTSKNWEHMDLTITADPVTCLTCRNRSESQGLPLHKEDEIILVIGEKGYRCPSLGHAERKVEEHLLATGILEGDVDGFSNVHAKDAKGKFYGVKLKTIFLHLEPKEVVKGKGEFLPKE